jgi:heterodisulfide reductase subunit C/nitrate reductase gamma subunit
MFYYISLYISLAIFIGGLIYKIATWLSRTIGVDAKDIPTAQRFSSALKGIIVTIFSAKILTLIKIFFLDVLLQRKVYNEDTFRLVTHILIYVAFMLLVLMHALDAFITAAVFSNYSATLNPFLFLRDLFGALVIIGICMAIYRRFILRPPRLHTHPMDTYAILLIAIIMVSGIILEGTKIGSYTLYKDMVTDYAGIEEGEEEFTALTAFWVDTFGTISPDIKAPFKDEIRAAGKELHEMSCSGCHSRPQWAFVGYPIARALKGAAGGLDKAGIHTVLLFIHFLACFIGLAYLPFSKFLHIITSPVSLLANSIMDKNTSDPANIATRQVLELDACTHCGACTARCSVGIIVEERGNVNILPSEKIQSIKGAVASKKQTDEPERRLILEGTYLCTNCHRCTDVCPSGINLEELWVTVREDMLKADSPEFSILSPLSFYRGLMRETIPAHDYTRPVLKARDAIAAPCDLMRTPDMAVTLTPASKELQGSLLLSDQAATFSACFGCQTCTNACPVVAAYENPKEVLGMLPHQIMYAAGLGIKDLAFGSQMLWDCCTCYQCQEQCPQGVHVTDVLYELKNLAIQNVARTGESVSG